MTGKKERQREGRRDRGGGHDLQCARRQLQRNFRAELAERVCVLYQRQLRTGNTLRERERREEDRKLAKPDHPSNPCD